MLGHDCHEADHRLVGLGHVSRHEANAFLLEAQQEVRVTAQAVQLGDDQGGSCH